MSPAFWLVAAAYATDVVWIGTPSQEDIARVHAAAGTSGPFDLADPGLCSEQLLAREQSGQLVGRLLGALDLERRVVLIMHDLLDVTTADIARDLDVKENTVRNRLRLARE